MAYVQEALGANDSGITLGPPVSLGPVNLGGFVKELAMEKGPFIYFTFDQVHKSGLPPLKANAADQDVRMFVAWLITHKPDFITYISNVMALHGTPMDKPKWVAEKKVRFKQAAYDLYKASMLRVREIGASQGLIEADPMDHAHFMNWWKKHDVAGWAAATVLVLAGGKGTYQVPAQLFGFWKVNNQGDLAPPNSLLGLGLWSMLKRNWLWLGAGAVGGAAAYKVLKRRREKKAFERSDTMLPNSGCCG